MSERLPDGLLVTFYGDDFTGSSAVMEAFAFAGLPTVLFLDAPTPEQLARFKDYRSIGIAGVARSQSPEWMDVHLPPIYRVLAGLGAPIAHYKVCSTFDSAPQVGSIGRAIDLAVPILGGAWHPLVVAAPNMERFQAFGNLFAAVGGRGYRLDRHPTMARHPVTPMDEADIRIHLARQTDKPIGLVDFVAMKRGEADAVLVRERDASEIVALDVLDDETLAEAGRLVWENRGERLFAVGSQGLQYALVAHWQKAGLLERPRAPYRASKSRQIACVSGSCSPVTAGQIAFARDKGFAAIPLAADRAVDPGSWEQEIGRAADRALAALGEGTTPLVYTASGPDDAAVGAMRAAVAASGVPADEVNARVGSGLGRILDRVLREGRLERAVIAGGDTSGFAARELGIFALTALAPIAPGSPLCQAHAEDGRTLEISLKGGQVGRADFFWAAREGGSV
jgi:uncharacterized protein YgbK (DUF1537 family)